ncbi:Heterokaryon incompatibility protein (HET) domain containing protein [Naviculisporaceae sp. PSN 640]
MAHRIDEYLQSDKWYSPIRPSRSLRRVPGSRQASHETPSSSNTSPSRASGTNLNSAKMAKIKSHCQYSGEQSRWHRRTDSRIGRCLQICSSWKDVLYAHGQSLRETVATKNTSRASLRGQAQIGRQNAPVVCGLRIVSLQDRPTFEALSYVWGDAAIKRHISVNGHVFPVTANLAEALHALRHRKLKSRILWVDAICINQDDVAEKNIQVPLMSRIYSEAIRVVAWLGPSNPAMELAVSYTTTYIEKKHCSRQALEWFKLAITARFSHRARKERLMAVLRATEGRLDILAVPYWTRMWTYQEYFLPKKEPLCLCGNLRFRVTSMLQADKFLVADTLKARSRLRDALNGEEDSDSGTEDGQDDSDLDNQYVAVTNKMDQPEPQFVRAATAKEAESAASYLSKLMVVTRTRLCFDPRDKIFALYGIASKAREVYPPDYSKPVEQVHLEATMFMVEHERYLPFSTFGLRNNDVDLSGNLPHRKAGFRPVSVSDDSTMLMVCGWRLGVVRVVMKFADSPSEVLEQIRGLLLHNPSSSPFPTNRNLTNLPPRSLITADSIIESVARLSVPMSPVEKPFSAPEVVEAFRAILLKDMESPRESEQRQQSDGQPTVLPSESESDHGNDMRDWCMGGIDEITGKLLFTCSTTSTTTQDNIGRSLLFGLGGGRITDGDVVVVTPELGPPLVLRVVATGPVQRSNASSDTANPSSPFKIAGVARVDGLMENLAPPNHELVEGLRSRDLERFGIL